MNTTTRGLCLATFAAYGACVREPGHDLPHRDAHRHEFMEHRASEPHPISAVLAAVNHATRNAEEGSPVYLSRADLAAITGLDLTTATDTAEAGARSGHLVRLNLRRRVYYARRVPGTNPAREWGRAPDRCPHCGKLRSVGHGPVLDAYCADAQAGRACGFIHPSSGPCVAGYMHVTNHMFGGAS